MRERFNPRKFVSNAISFLLKNGYRPVELRLTDEQLNGNDGAQIKAATGEGVKPCLLVKDDRPGPDGLTRSTVIGVIIPAMGLPEPGIPIDPGDLI